MALTGEAKREWRRKNREKHKVYNQEWRQNNPDKIAATNDRVKEKRQAKMSNNPKVIACRMFCERLRSDELFALEVANRKREKSLRRKTNYPNGWNWQTIERIKKQLSANITQSKLSEWEKKFQSLSRGLRFRNSLLQPEQKKTSTRLPTDWLHSIKIIKAIIGKSNPSAWQLKMARIRNNMKLRSRINHE